MPIYSPTGFLDVTNATLRTSNIEAENFKLNGGNIYVSTDFTVAPTLQLITNGGSVTSNTVQFSNVTTGLVADSNIVVTGNVTAGYLHGDASNVTAVPAAQVTGTLVVANGGTGTTTSTGTGSVVLSDAPTFTGDVTFDTNTLFVDSVNDRVGVGTTSPGAKMDIYTGSTGTVGLSFDRFASGNYRTDIYQNTYGLDFRVGYAENTPESVLYLKRFSDGSKEVEINGNVGIGTTTPGDKLHLYGATDSTLRVETDTGQAQLLLRSGASTRRACRIDFSRADTGTQYMQLIGDYQQNGTDDLTVATSTSGRIMTWLQNGNVGIGTTSPGAPLAVVSTRNADTWAADKSQLDVLNDNGQGSTYGMSFAVSQTRGDGIIQTFNRNTGNAEYDLILQPNSGRVGIGTTNPTATLHVNGTMSYNTKQATHQKNAGLAYTSSNASQNLRNVTISADGIAHVHVTGLWRMSAFSGTNGTDTEAAYFSIRKNSTEVTAGSVGHRVAKLGNVNDTNQWKPIVLSWSGAVSSGDTINVYASSIENNIEFNELDLNVLVV